MGRSGDVHIIALYMGDPGRHLGHTSPHAKLHPDLQFAHGFDQRTRMQTTRETDHAVSVAV